MSETASRRSAPTSIRDEPLLTSDEWNDDCECLHPDAVARARAAIGHSVPADDLARVFVILGDPTRVRILVALGGSELCVTDIAAATGANRTTISHQLRTLRGERLVRRRREGKVVYYAVDDDHVSSLLHVAATHLGESGIRSAGERIGI